MSFDEILLIFSWIERNGFLSCIILADAHFCNSFWTDLSNSTSMDSDEFGILSDWTCSLFWIFKFAYIINISMLTNIKI